MSEEKEVRELIIKNGVVLDMNEICSLLMDSLILNPELRKEKLTKTLEHLEKFKNATHDIIVKIKAELNK